ncbi:sigma-70 family RNA polymerase sigma factor [Zavarzinella formosa]|uniref:sigma-70 family RNA polymerase sigma factor n=1 Tax=Zavarzinella formosa TaxID=360055 RepID=UPI0002FD12BC|nr:sigma-70 family RNA polymerase sigma factor [Zavarzinella formosa]
MTDTKPKRVFRHLIPLTPEQAELVAGVWKLLWKLARRYTPGDLRHHQWAVELTHDQLLQRAMAAARTFDPENGAKFTTYFGKFALPIANRFWIDRLRNNVPAESFDSTKAEEDIPFRDTIAAPAEPESPMLADHLAVRAVRSLPFRQRQAITLTLGLFGVQPRTSAEAGEIMGCTDNSVRGSVSLGLANLRTWAENTGVTE